MNSEIFRIIILEDDTDFCEAVQEMLGNESFFEIAEIFHSCQSFLANLNGKEWSNINLFWIDLNLPDGSGIDIIQEIKERYPLVKCLVCTFQSDDTNLFLALKQGADGYVLKDMGVNSFLQSLQDMVVSGATMSPSIAKKIIQSFRPEMAFDLINLTKREQEVLELLAKGLLYKEIGVHLGISLETTKKHISNIYQKLHVQNRTEAIKKLWNK